MGHPDFGELFRCPACGQHKLTGQLREQCGLPDQALDLRLIDLEVAGRPGTARVVQACREFLAHPVGILTICGGTGNGKSAALRAVTAELVRAGTEVVCICASALLDQIRSGYEDDGKEGAEARLKRFVEIKVLVIDELDKVNLTPWATEKLTTLLDRRYELGTEEGRQGTLLAMNEPPECLPAWLTSRLRDGRNRVVENSDPDIRPELQ